MTLFEKSVVVFLIVWVLMLVSALLVRSIRGDKERVPRSVWINWGSVFMLSLMQLVRLHPSFLHTHETLVLGTAATWTCILLWNLWGTLGSTKSDGEHRRELFNDWAKPDK